MTAFDIRDTPAPQEEEEALLDAAFGPARRAKASYRLREGSRAVPGLRFSAFERETGRLAAVLSFWPLRVAPRGERALLLGPLAVHPDFQNGGLGGALLRHGLEAARAQGHGLVFLVGDAPYYARYGFRQVPAGRVILPGPFDAARLMFLELKDGAFAGVEGLLLAPWRFHSVADVDSAAEDGRRSPA